MIKKKNPGFRNIHTPGLFSLFQTNFRVLDGQCLVREYSYNLSPPSYERMQNILEFPKFSR